MAEESHVETTAPAREGDTRGRAATPQAIRARLEAERERIRREIELRAAELPAYDGSPTDSRYSNHSADQGTDTFEEQKALALHSHFVGELREVERALRRLETGRYGRCEDCGQEIDPERLGAMPYVPLCIRCQSRAEARR